MTASSSALSTVERGAFGPIGASVVQVRKAPLLHGGRADAVAPGQCPYPRFTSLDRATHCLCRRGAAVKNLARSASFQEGCSTVALHPGTEHLDHVVSSRCRTSSVGCDDSAWRGSA
jgi:hypothetical protein